MVQNSFHLFLLTFFSVVTRQLKIIYEVCGIFLLNSTVPEQLFSDGGDLCPLSQDIQQIKMNLPSQLQISHHLGSLNFHNQSWRDSQAPSLGIHGAAPRWWLDFSVQFKYLGLCWGRRRGQDVITGGPSSWTQALGGSPPLPFLQNVWPTHCSHSPLPTHCSHSPSSFRDAALRE